MHPQKKPIAYDNLPEASLLDQWYAGDERAFEKICEKYYGLAIAFCISLCKSRQTSEDITQETFLRIYKKVSENKGKRIEDFKRYLFASLTKNFLEHIRKSKKQEAKINQAKIISLSEVSEDVEIERFMNEDVLASVLSCLNGKQKEVYKQQLNGYKINEIAEKNNMTADQVRGLLFRAREKLKQKKEFLLGLIYGKERPKHQ